MDHRAPRSSARLYSPRDGQRLELERAEQQLPGNASPCTSMRSQLGPTNECHEVVIAGVATRFRAESTARQTHENGVNVTPVFDAITATNPTLTSTAITWIFPKLGETSTTDDNIDLLAGNRLTALQQQSRPDDIGGLGLLPASTYFGAMLSSGLIGLILRSESDDGRRSFAFVFDD